MSRVLAMDEGAGVNDPTPVRPVSDAPVTGAAAAYARHLLTAGLVGGNLGLIGSAVVFGALRGVVGGASAATGALLAIIFFAVGQLVVLRFTERDGATLLVAALASYGMRVAGLAGAWWAYEASGLDVLDRTATAAGVVVTVLLWTTAEVVAYARMRIPAYDVDYTGPRRRAGK